MAPATKEMPEPLPLSKLLGPSFIILALGLGSGEIILWPYLTSNFGLGIAWGALLGLTFQYFMNMEIERYALVRGESVFVGLNKRFSLAPYWFIASTFIGFGIPGIIAASSAAFSSLFGITDIRWPAIAFLLLIGAILSLGKTVYGLMETITKTILMLGPPFVLLLALLVSSPQSWLALGEGLVGIGQGYLFLPAGISLAAFLAAFAYSGAGGNLNLTQSIYIKEKGYGMGAYAQRISGLFASRSAEKIRLAGEPFEATPTNIARFRAWWKRVSLEHLIVFWGVGIVTILFLMLLAYSTTYLGGVAKTQDISFVIAESQILGQRLLPAVGLAFLAAVAILLFQTQLGVMDSTSRIMAENFAVKRLAAKKERTINLSRIYFTFLWAQIAFGVLLFLLNFTQPLQLIVLGAVINAVAMFVHLGLVNWMNYKDLPREVQPSVLRRAIMVGIFLFFGAFSAFTIWSSVLG